MNYKKSIEHFVNECNSKKQLFTAGPASLCTENILGLEPCFGRGDKSYLAKESRVLKELKKISGQNFIVRMQGSGSTALEIMINNFAYGKVLVIDTGYYSLRAAKMAEYSKITYKNIKEVNLVNWNDYSKIEGFYDFVIACYTETSIGLKLNLKKIKKISEKFKAKLMLDATASIGLEDDHHLADALCFSSCKGLFGLTGACFVGYKERGNISIPSFGMNIDHHLNKMMTGPYHAICSLDLILKNYQFFRCSVEETKKDFLKRFNDHLVFPKDLQPKLCTQVKVKIKSNLQTAILYEPRSIKEGNSVVCHLGEAHLGNNSKGNINKMLYI